MACPGNPFRCRFFSLFSIKIHIFSKLIYLYKWITESFELTTVMQYDSALNDDFSEILSFFASPYWMFRKIFECFASAYWIFCKLLLNVLQLLLGIFPTSRDHKLVCSNGTQTKIHTHPKASLYTILLNQLTYTKSLQLFSFV